MWPVSEVFEFLNIMFDNGAFFAASKTIRGICEDGFVVERRRRLSDVGEECVAAIVAAEAIPDRKE